MVTGREGKLLLQGIGEGITEDDESRRPAELLVAAAMEMGPTGLGFGQGPVGH